MEAITAAAENGHVEIVRYLWNYLPDEEEYEEDFEYPIDKDVMTRAARNGHLEVVRFLWDNGASYDCDLMMPSAIDSGNIEVVEFLLSYNVDCRYVSIALAVDEGRLDLVRNMVEDGAIVENNDIDRARQRGYHDIAEYLEGVLGYR